MALERVIGIGILLSLKDRLTRPVLSANAGLATFNETADAAVLKTKAMQTAFMAGGAMMMAGGGIIAALGGTVSAAAEIEDIMFRVQMASGLTNKEIAQLTKNLIELSGPLPLSAKQLAEVAFIGAKLGVASKSGAAGLEKLAFSAAKLAKASEDLTEPAAAEALSRLASIYGIDIVDSAEKMGSTMVALAQSTTASEAMIVELTQRFGPMAKAAKLTVQETMAFAATMRETGISAEEGGTSLTRLFAAMSDPKRIGAFAKHLGLTVEQYKEMSRLEPAGIVVRLARSFRGLDRFAATARLREFGLARPGAVKTMLGMATVVDQLDQNLRLANSTFASGTALQEKFDIMSKSVVARMQILYGNIKNVAIVIGSILLPFISVVLRGLNLFFMLLQKLPRPIIILGVITAAAAGSLLFLAGAVLVAASAYGFLNQRIAMSIALLTTQAATSKVAAAALGFLTLASKAFAAVVAFLASTVGLVIMAVIAAVAIFALLARGTQSANKWVRAFAYTVLIMLGPIGMMIAAFSMLYSWLKKAQQRFNFLGKVFAPLRAAVAKLGEAWDKLKQKLAPVFEWLSGYLDGLIWTFGFIAGFITARIVRSISFAVEMVTRLVDAITWSIDFLSISIDWVVTRFELARNIIVGLFTAAAEMIKAPFLAVRDVVTTTINDMYNNVRALISNIPDVFLPKSLEAVKAQFIAERKLADGGIVTRPTTALLGERGPEAVIPLGSHGAPRMGALRLAVTIPVSLDGRELFRVMKEYEAEEDARSFSIPLRLATSPGGM